MARLIPPYVKDNIASNGEKKIFEIFQKMDYECTIFHSLGLAEHRYKVFGEIDFVVVSKEGILCLEVKGGRVYREDGVWHFVDRNGIENRNNEGPFTQVVGSMYSLRDYVKNYLGYQDSLYKCQYACGVIFPDITFKQKGTDIIPEVVYDERFTDEQMIDYIKSAYKYWRNKCLEKDGFEGQYLSVEQIKKAEKFLRGNFGVIPSLNTILDEVDNKLITVTQEQYNILEMLSENERVILKGGAGTGKTMLGMEQARRQALKNKKTLYVCFNKMLANYLRGGVENEDLGIKENLKITYFHELLMETVNEKPDWNIKDSDLYFEKLLPEKFLDHVIALGIEKFDFLVIDEGQDLLKLNYMMCFDELLKGGLSGGKWLVLYDSNQNIYNRDFEEGINELKKYGHTNLTLNVNCRNTKQIGTYNTLLSGIKSAKYLKVIGEDVVKEAYKDNSDLREKLLKLVKNLRGQGANVGDIVILSPYSFENSCFEGTNIFKNVCTFQNITSTNYKNVLRESLKFSTVQSFKGMESKIVILVDLDKFKDKYARLLNYTAISRARTLIYIFYKNEAKGEMFNVVDEGLEIIANQSS